jgi:hypothetical protein
MRLLLKLLMFTLLIGVAVQRGWLASVQEALRGGVGQPPAVEAAHAGPWPVLSALAELAFPWNLIAMILAVLLGAAALLAGVRIVLGWLEE